MIRRERIEEIKWLCKYFYPTIVNMDGRNDLSYMQLHTGMRPKNYFDKEMKYFVPNKSQLPDLQSRVVPKESTLTDRLLNIQNYYRDAAPYTPSDHIRREASNHLEGTSLNPLSNKMLYTIHRADDPRIEQEIIKGVLLSNRMIRGQNPQLQWEQTIRRSDLIKEADLVLETLEEKII